MSRTLDRVADAGGLLYVVLAGVGFGVFAAPALPDLAAAPGVVLRQLRDHPVGATFWTGIGLESAGLVLLLLFAVRLADRIHRAGPGGWQPVAVVALAATALAVKLASFAPVFAALHAGRYDASTVAALFGTNDMSDYVSSAVDGVVVLLAGLAAWPVRALPRWLAAGAVVAGLAVLVGIAIPGLFDSLQLLLFLWLVVTSGWLLLRGGRSAAPAAQGMPAASSAVLPA